MDNTEYLFEVIGSLSVVIILIYFSLWVIKKIHSRLPNHGDSIILHAMMRIGSKEKIAVIETHDRKYLIGVSQSSITLLERLDDAANSATTELKPPKEQPTVIGEIG